MNDTKFGSLATQEPIKNRVANSGLMVINLEDFYPENIIPFDIKPFLFEEKILREKPFRVALQTHNRHKYTNKIIYVFCSSKTALIQQWAWMLVAAHLHQVTPHIYFGNKQQTIANIFRHEICNLDIEQYRNQRVILSGCSAEKVPDSAYFLLAKRLQPIVTSLMYGDACSSVPVFKKKVKK